MEISAHALLILFLLNTYVRHWYSEIMAIIHLRPKAATTSLFFLSHHVHLLNKHRTASKLKNNILRLSSLQCDFDQTIGLDKTSLFELLSLNSTRDYFKYLRSFTRKRLLNQMQLKDKKANTFWKDTKATNFLKKANLMNDYFYSVFLPRWSSALYAHDNPSILLNMHQISVVQVETSLASASTTCLTNDNLPTFVHSNCSNTIAPLVVQLFC